MGIGLRFAGVTLPFGGGCNSLPWALMTLLFGVTLGMVLLLEPLTPQFVGGAVLVLLGITLVSGEPWLRRRLARGG